DFRNVYLRRSATLLAIGMIHAFLIWSGDILMSYALASFALLLFRDASPRKQLAWGIFFACAGGDIVNPSHLAPGPIYPLPPPWPIGGALNYGTGTLLEIQRHRFRDVWWWWGTFGLQIYFPTVGAFLLGTWAYRSGLVQRVIAVPRTTRRFLGICAVV